MRERNAAGVALAALCLGLYWLTGYGGVRSPDCEVVFRTAESLALRGTWAIQPLEDWPQFGTAVGTDGRRYSKFGPLPSLVLAPAVWMGKAFERAGCAERVGGLVPLSHFAGGGLRHLRQGSRPADLRPHFLRFAASWVNPLLAALGVFAFWRLARRLSSSPGQAWRAALLYAFATPLWAYAGTFFSEPLAILFILLALERLTALDRSIALEERPATGAASLAAGLLGGAACLSHLTAALFLPPLLAYAFYGGRDGEAGWKEGVRSGAAFAGGAGVLLTLLGAFNWMRFGSPFVGGRTTTFGHFFWPWSARFWSDLHGLLIGGGKGLLWFCPLLLLAAFAWPAFRRRHRLLADVVLGAVLLRIAFMAAYKDWHGGICLGPRYLLMLVPLILLALPAWLDGAEPRFRPAVLAVAGAIGVIQQAFFVTGEPFAYYHGLKASFLERGMMPTDAQVFTQWQWSPAWRLLEGPLGPWSLKGITIGNYWVWGGLSVAVLGVLLVAGRLGRYR